MDTETESYDDDGPCEIPYVAPEILKTGGTIKDYTKRSDIYSLGVILWVISSGKPPFEDYDHKHDMILIGTILSKIREERIPGTPDEYYELYSKCWDEEPEKRHTIEEV